MNVNKMLSENSFLIGLNPSSKKQILEQMSKLAEEQLNISSRDILDNLVRREKLGSTAVGNGIAIPHVIHTNIEKPKGFIAILSSGLDFNATDNQLVDIIFLLIAPSDNGSQHLQALASVSRLFRNTKLVSKLRGCYSTESAMAVITQSVQEEAA